KARQNTADLRSRWWFLSYGVYGRFTLAHAASLYLPAHPWSRLMLTARDIMTTQVVTIRPTESVRTAVERLIAEQISGLPVVDETGRMVGIVTEFALLATA